VYCINWKYVVRHPKWWRAVGYGSASSAVLYNRPNVRLERLRPHAIANVWLKYEKVVTRAVFKRFNYNIDNDLVNSSYGEQRYAYAYDSE
jgi:hypothetical protein